MASDSADSYKRQIKQMVNFILQEAKCVLPLPSIANHLLHASRSPHRDAYLQSTNSPNLCPPFHSRAGHGAGKRPTRSTSRPSTTLVWRSRSRCTKPSCASSKSTSKRRRMLRRRGGSSAPLFPGKSAFARCRPEMRSVCYNCYRVLEVLPSN